ncbi:GNAT family N-acetyltransferase [Clostridium sp. MD294]|uniref:GNAT family N-acetyltransferase n=1 Tax=Clostridium sp. MD294 TaxID=97138 RepID=UPI0002CB4068|nr:GNAT family N-acetyltransferase [Clostridium sp. MD294]NDO46750.1 GNAT family N-acetyltransferase [Clostridium sp. MD294]USF28809.1 hypothetical protein C820_000183 [Clostridium sp. MD294]
MKKTVLKKLRHNPQLVLEAAKWFSEKWDIPKQEYENSMKQCICQKSIIPQWYVMMNEYNEIIAGAGVIENDFHEYKHLKPNLCALFVEEEYRKKGIAKCILDFVIEDIKNMGIKKLYLVTDYTAFYERCGWNFLCMVKDEQEILERMYVFHIV